MTYRCTFCQHLLVCLSPVLKRLSLAPFALSVGVLVVMSVPPSRFMVAYNLLPFASSMQKLRNTNRPPGPR